MTTPHNNGGSMATIIDFPEIVPDPDVREIHALDIFNIKNQDFLIEHFDTLMELHHRGELPFPHANSNFWIRGLE